ncbi:hypothetical protein D3C71_1849040 [compost metagenome]
MITAAEPQVGQLHSAGLQSFADAGAAHLLTVQLKRRNGLNLHEVKAQLPKLIGVALPLVSETEVKTDNRHNNIQGTQHIRDKVLRADL